MTNEREMRVLKAIYTLRISNEDGTTANILIEIPFIETDLAD